MTEDLVDSILRCGLYFGAMFQVICITAAVVIPDKMNDFTANYKEAEGSEDEASDRSTPQATPRRPAHAHTHTHAHHRARKQEKKKRR